MRLALCLPFALAAALLPAQEALFTPKVQAPTVNPVPLEVRPGTNLQIVRARLDGVPCTLLFDTGASHTTFDRGFVERAFPGRALHPIALGGETNVASAPAAFRIGALTLGNATLRDFLGMVLPLGHLSEAVGTKVDGILGMNAMAYAPFALSVGEGRVTWYPEGTPRPKGTPLPVVSGAQKRPILSLKARAKPDGKTFPVLIDSGASLTVLDGAHWPAEGEEHAAFSTVDVNSASEAAFRKGKPGELLLGGFRLPVRPLLNNGSRKESTLGADALRGVTLLIDGRRRTVAVIGRTAP